MKLAKLAKAGAVVALSAVFLAACGKSSNDSASGKQVLNWSEKSELPTMDLSKATDHVSFDQLNNAMEGLYRLGKNSKVEPGVAKKTTVSDDGMTYTFELRKDAKWSNGDNVTAKDFVYSFDRHWNDAKAETPVLGHITRTLPPDPLLESAGRTWWAFGIRQPDRDYPVPIVETESFLNLEPAPAVRMNQPFGLFCSAWRVLEPFRLECVRIPPVRAGHLRWPREGAGLALPAHRVLAGRQQGPDEHRG